MLLRESSSCVTPLATEAIQKGRRRPASASAFQVTSEDIRPAGPRLLLGLSLQRLQRESSPQHARPFVSIFLRVFLEGLRNFIKCFLWHLLTEACGFSPLIY